MVDQVTSRRWRYHIVYLAVCAIIIFIQILPFRIAPNQWPGPDILTLLACAWVLRRPDYVPPGIIALAALCADLLFMRPLGLWAAITVLGVEFLRNRAHLSRDLPFLVEWLMVAGVLFVMTLAQGVVLAVFLVDQPAIGLVSLQLVISMLSYPLVVGATAHVFKVRKTAPGQVDALGHRL
ncbi:rod shape-determining protein MreD [Profundibacterium mesophilum]|uniref:Rod shape-determining protein MreD n=1 Tax=Profundibacterium mesophilum KAUST100406-0324 TaxID=1037889 RepID=A0A921NZZ3_9RHOB|nr:rod shape-determining protein MreD [Profundibacterium mesophilum]KAF0676658.1 hypothetical protein PMES_00948 [Profundibacterium mesophilum KAUST100406-0324]